MEEAKTFPCDNCGQVTEGWCSWCGKCSICGKMREE